MSEMRLCINCNNRKPTYRFRVRKDATGNEHFCTKCKKCESFARAKQRDIERNYKYPYALNMKKMLKDSKYIKDKNELFNKHGNGWWYGDGWWNGKTETIADKTRRYDKTGTTLKDIW